MRWWTRFVTSSGEPACLHDVCEFRILTVRSDLTLDPPRRLPFPVAVKLPIEHLWEVTQRILAVDSSGLVKAENSAVVALLAHLPDLVSNGIRLLHACIHTARGLLFMLLDEIMPALLRVSDPCI